MKKLKVGDVLVCSIARGNKEDEIMLNCTVVPLPEDISSEYGKYGGIVVDEEVAKNSLCYRIGDTNLVFSKGVIGALSKEQIEKYCSTIIERKPNMDTICVRLDDFYKLVKEIQKRIQEITEK